MAKKFVDENMLEELVHKHDYVIQLNAEDAFGGFKTYEVIKDSGERNSMLIYEIVNNNISIIQEI